jgi:hypothetical protein
MTPNLLVGLSHWTIAEINAVRSVSPCVRGVIVGDPFCAARGSRHGVCDIPDLAAAAHACGLGVAFQTPAYLTPRNFRFTVDLLRKLLCESRIDWLLVQDMGLVSLLPELGGTLPVCWTLWARRRADYLNRDFLAMLQQFNVTHVETDEVVHLDRLRDAGLQVVYRWRGGEAASFGRVCYTQCVRQRPCTNGRLCLEQKTVLSAGKGTSPLAVVGHMLVPLDAPPRSLPTSPVDLVTVHVDTTRELAEVLDHAGASRLGGLP